MPNKLMRAMVVAEPGRVEAVRIPLPEPGPGQVRVGLEGCGVCTSNLPPWEGKPWFSYPMEPGALGHEGWGHVDSVGDAVRGVDVGDRVAMLSGHAYADYDVCSASAVVKLPPSLDAQPFPGEPLGCAMKIFRRSGIAAGDTVAIVGIGFLGTLLCRLASNAGARVIAIGRRPFSLLAAANAGAQIQIPMDDHWRIIDEVKKLTDGTLCDVVIEATGKQWPLDLSAELTREMGRLVVAGYHQDGPRQVNMQLWNWRGLDVINAHERVDQVYIDGIQLASKAAEAGQIDFQPLLTHFFPLERLAEALDVTRDRPDGFMKAVVVMR